MMWRGLTRLRAFELDEDEPDRKLFDIAELRKLFGSPIFTAKARPKAGRGEAAYWLPLLALFTGCRRGELAALTVADLKDVGRSCDADVR